LLGAVAVVVCAPAVTAAMPAIAAASRACLKAMGFSSATPPAVRPERARGSGVVGR